MVSDDRNFRKGAILIYLATLALISKHAKKAKGHCASGGWELQKGMRDQLASGMRLTFTSKLQLRLFLLIAIHGGTQSLSLSYRAALALLRAASMKKRMTPSGHPHTGNRDGLSDKAASLMDALPLAEALRSKVNADILGGPTQAAATRACRANVSASIRSTCRPPTTRAASWAWRLTRPLQQ